MAADANVVMTHITTSALTVAAINWLKASPVFPWITKAKTNLLRLLSGLAAAGFAVGIHASWNSADHSLVITGLSYSAVGLAIWEFLKQFAMNEMIHQATKNKSGNGGSVPVVQAQQAMPAK